jgi:hypothetical protein
LLLAHHPACFNSDGGLNSCLGQWQMCGMVLMMLEACRPTLPLSGGKKRRSGKQRRRHRAAKDAAEAREERRAQQQELERRTGSEGLFATLNSIIGDGNAAHAAKQARLGLLSGPGGPGPGQPLTRGQPRGAVYGDSGANKGDAKGSNTARVEDRRQLAQRAAQLAQLRSKVQRLK